MTEYGVMLNNQLIRHKTYQEGDKPILYTEMPSSEGYRAIYHWEETEQDIIQAWELVEDDSDYEDYHTADEILSILIGGAT